MWYVQGGTVAVRTVGLGTRNSELGTPSLGLGVPLGSAEHGGRVAGDLQGTLNVDPNPNGIVPLQRELESSLASGKFSLKCIDFVQFIRTDSACLKLFGNLPRKSPKCSFST